MGGETSLAASEAVRTPATEGGRTVRYAGFGVRAAALLVDGIILVALDRILHVSPDDRLHGFLVNTAYFFLLYVLARGQTVGKMLFGIRVVRADGGPLRMGTALLRAAFYAVDALLAGLGFLTVFFSRERRALHDIVLGTRVVHVASGQRAARGR
jgi:uncharacterized RDD family membrane protein YckC